MVEGHLIRMFSSYEDTDAGRWWHRHWFVGDVADFIEGLASAEDWKYETEYVSIKCSITTEKEQGDDLEGRMEMSRQIKGDMVEATCRHGLPPKTVAALTNPSTATQKESALLAIPLELRTMIYRLLLSDTVLWQPLERSRSGRRQAILSHQVSPMLCVNRQIRQEILDELNHLARCTATRTHYTLAVNPIMLDAPRLLSTAAASKLTDVLIRFDNVPAAPAVKENVNQLILHLRCARFERKRTLKIHLLYSAGSRLRFFDMMQSPVFSPASLTLPADLEISVEVYTSQSLHNPAHPSSGTIHRLAHVKDTRDYPAAFACVSSETQVWVALLGHGHVGDGVKRQAILEELGSSFPEYAQTSALEMEVLTKWVRGRGRVKCVELQGVASKK